MAKDNQPHFEVHPSVVYQLGESLISDAVQALIELVKNCYDADATYAKVVIDTQGSLIVDGAIFPSTGGRIIVEDDGRGMSLDDIKSGWLTISNRKKREMKRAKETTVGGRTPLGDKGLGRLGVQRLGENLEIFTKGNGEDGYHFGFSWLDFETAPKLEDVDIHLTELKNPKKQGTKVVISSLKEPNIWRGQAELKRLEQALSGMISPYKQIRDFAVVVEVDGKPLELLEISERLRDIAPVRYSIRFDGQKLSIQGRAKLDFFRPSQTEKAEHFALTIESDNGQAFLDFLKSQNLAKTLNLSRSPSKQWFIEFGMSRSIDELDKIVRLSPNDRVIANPGPFSGEVDSFDLGSDAYQALPKSIASVFDRLSEYRQRIKDLSGIKVYRDGFRVRVDHDWLKLGSQWTSALSYYGLKPETTSGYIALSARDNIELEETTDREGFKDTPYHRNFIRLMDEFKSFTATAHEFLGRSSSEFRKKKTEVLAKVDSRKTVEDISRTIKNGLTEATQHQKDLNALKSCLTASASAAKAVVSRLQSAKEVTPELRANVTEALTALEPLIVEAEDVITRLAAYLEHVSSLQRMGQVLEDRVDSIRRQMDEMYEAIALGLTAEALSHEVYNVADQLAKRAKSVQLAVRRNEGTLDRPILAFVEYVQSSIIALRKQMSFLSPSLRYVRDVRHDINVKEFLGELADFYFERLNKNKITIALLQHDSMPFNIRMNKGKLTQVIDNLVLNSEYWLKEDIGQGRMQRGVITIEISTPFICLYDDGSGIAPSIESALFEPFISAKKQGRGLGLFIVKQLLDSESCSIGLLPDRNQNHRLFKFQIDLRGALHE